MPRKDIYIYDSSSEPLKIAGIKIDLLDAVNGQLLDTQLSENLSKKDDEWGAKLTFEASQHPLDIVIEDASYKYPGNTVRSLNGRRNDRIDLDLQCLPSEANALPEGVNPQTTIEDLVQWIQDSPNWSSEDQQAVCALVFNYLSIVVPKFKEFANQKQSFALNWEKALSRLGLDVSSLHQVRSGKKKKLSAGHESAQEEPSAAHELERSR